MRTKEKGMLSIESNNIFAILKKWLYTEPDVVFRELISNATDAIEKLTMLSSEDKSIPSVKGRIDVKIDPDNKTMIVSDNGLGMDFEEVQKYINQIAFSGAEEYISENSQAGKSSIIGHFGVGFYSAFMMADHVAIETKSYKEDAQGVRWDCTSDMSFDMEYCDKKHTGTDVILYMNEDAPFLNQAALALESIKKYFAFSKYEIFFTSPEFDKVKVNDADPIWKKTPEEIDETAMHSFYKTCFDDESDPLFWVQFSSLDIGIRGIFFFRNTKNGTAELDGKIKVYSRGIYIGENIQGLIPKFVNLQSGIIECDDLPLLVSRSHIQESDENPENILNLINECLTQEMTIALNDLYTNDRPLYEAHWPELNAFVKYGVLQDRTFASVMTKKVIFEDVYGNYRTIKEFNDLENYDGTVYYASDKLDQAHYISIFKKCGKNALIFDHVIDQPFLLKYEVADPNLKFVRIDSNIKEVFGDTLDERDQPAADALRKKITAALSSRLQDMKLAFTRLDDNSISALIVNDENARRMSDMMEIYGYANKQASSATPLPVDRTLIFNLNNPIVLGIHASDDNAKVSSIANQLFDLALLSQQALKPEDMEAFINRSEAILGDAINGGSPL